MKKERNNKGFSLVELIIVIAIMAVLVGVLAPQFIKYVGQSKRATDIQNVQSIATAYLTDIADGTISTNIGTAAAPVAMSNTNKPSTITTLPTTKGSLATGAVTSKGAVTAGTTYKVFVDVAAGEVKIYVGDSATLSELFELYPGADSEKYKNGK